MPQKEQKTDYHALSQELQELIAKLEAGDIDIDEAVQCYERGLVIVKLLETRLTRAENKVVELAKPEVE